MRGTRTIICAALGLITIASADVQAVEEAKVLEGYNCMSVNYKALNVTEEEAYNGTGLQPVFVSPTEGSKKLGTTGGMVYVDWPLNKVNGFVRMLRPNGEHAWIHEIALKPFGNASPSAITCTLARDERGLIRFKTFDAAPAGR